MGWDASGASVGPMGRGERDGRTHGAESIRLGTVYPRWLGWVAVGSGVAWIVHGLLVPYIGLFPSIPRGVAQVLMYLWAFIMAFVMWRNSGRQPIVSGQAASRAKGG